MTVPATSAAAVTAKGASAAVVAGAAAGAAVAAAASSAAVVTDPRDGSPAVGAPPVSLTAFLLDQAGRFIFDQAGMTLA